MGVTDTTNTIKESGNDVKTEYTFDFKAFLSTDLKVYKIDTTTLVATLQTLTTDYSVSLNAITEGGTVTYVTAPTSSEYSFIKRELAFTQSTDVDTEDGLPSSSLNNEYDRSRMIDIQLKEESDRTLKFAETSDLSDIVVPESTSAAARASKVIAYDSAGTGLELVSTNTGTNVDPIATKGDLVQGDATGDAEKLAIGSNDDTLQVAAGIAAWTSQPTIADMTNATHDHADAAGGGATLQSPTIVTPTIASMTNAQHDHSNAANGGFAGVLQVVSTQDGTMSQHTTAMPFDNTIPQNDEGEEIMTRAITPAATSHRLMITVNVFFAHDNNINVGIALFQDSTANALASGFVHMATGAADEPHHISFVHEMEAGTTSETTFKVRLGGSDGTTTTWNGVSGSQRMGGSFASSITIMEIVT